MPQAVVTSHLTAEQGDAMRTEIVNRLDILGERAARAAIAIDDLAGTEFLQEREVAQNALQSLKDAIRLHEEALRDLDAGSYGLCGACHRPIPFERLEAIPEAVRCVACTRIG